MSTSSESSGTRSLLKASSAGVVAEVGELPIVIVVSEADAAPLPAPQLHSARRRCARHPRGPPRRSAGSCKTAVSAPNVFTASNARSRPLPAAPERECCRFAVRIHQQPLEVPMGRPADRAARSRHSRSRRCAGGRPSCRTASRRGASTAGLRAESSSNPSTSSYVRKARWVKGMMMAPRIRPPESRRLGPASRSRTIDLRRGQSPANGRHRCEMPPDATHRPVSLGRRFRPTFAGPRRRAPRSSRQEARQMLASASVVARSRNFAARHCPCLHSTSSAPVGSGNTNSVSTTSSSSRPALPLNPTRYPSQGE